ncbi:hypothetical protein [Endozoicomonas numazuensis]
MLFILLIITSAQWL